MQEIIVAIQDAVNIESGADLSESSKAQSSRKTLLTSFLDIQSPYLSSGALAPSGREINTMNYVAVERFHNQ